MAAMTALVASAPAWLGTAVSLGGAAIGAVGALREGRAAEQAGEHNAQVSERNAEIVEQNRRTALETARIDTEERRRNSRRTLAAIRTQYGASGLSLAGSPLDVLEDTAAEEETGARRIEYEGRVRAREGALQADRLREDAQTQRAEGRSARRASRYSAARNLLTGAGRSLARL